MDYDRLLRSAHPLAVVEFLRPKLQGKPSIFLFYTILVFLVRSIF